MKKLLSIAVFAIFSASSAMSASLGDLNISVGISGNHGGFAGEGTERNNNETGSVKSTTTEYGAFTDSFGSIFVELGNDVISIGVDYVPSAIETPENKSREGNSTKNDGRDPGVSKVQVDFDDLTTYYVKLNIPLGGLYLKAGFHETDVVINESMDSGNSYADTSTDGYTAGLGYAHEVDGGMSIRAELVAMSFEDVTTNNGVAASGNRNVINVDSMWGARGTISLVKSF